MRAASRARSVANLVNLSTPLGVLVAVAGRARLARGPDGLLLATGYRLPLPMAPAFTVGSVVVLRHADLLARHPRLLAHEARHASQWACCLGLPLLPLYGLGALRSWWLHGDAASGNWFERRAGLLDGGYVERDRRRRLPRRR